MDSTLLDRLAADSGVNYISDLHSPYRSANVYQAVCKVSPEDFSLKEWEEAVKYILKSKDIHFHSQEDAQVFLKNRLEQP